MTRALAQHRAAVGAVVVAALLAAGPAPPHPSESLPRRLPADGTEVFRELFAVEGVTPVPSFDAADDLRSLILVLFGRPTADARAGELSAAVLAAGGAVLILAEQPSDLGPFFPAAEPTGLTVTGERVYCPNTDNCLDGDRWFPLVRTLDLDKTAGPSPFARPIRVATNVPSVLRLTRSSRYAAELAYFPQDCQFVGRRGRHLVASEEGGARRPFAVGGAGRDDDPFRCLVLSDPSVFINDMVVRGAVVPAGGADEPENLRFAVEIVRWLRGPEKRARCLFVEAGHARPSFSDAGLTYRPGPPPLPPVPPFDPLDPRLQAALTDAADRALARAEDANRFNAAITGDPRNDGRFGSVLRTLAGVVAVGGVGWLLVRVRAARTPAAVAAVRAEAAAGRPADLIRSGQLTEPVREFVVEMFVGRGMATGAASGPAPKVEATGAGATALARRVRAVWDQVVGPAATPVTTARWKELQPMIDEAWRAAEAGRWNVRPGGRAS